MSSMETGTIFPARSDHDLSRNGFVVFVYALYRNPSWRIGRRGGPDFSKKRPLHEASRILAALPGAKRLPGAEPPARPPKSDLLHGADVFSKILVHHADLSSKRDFCITHKQTQRIHSQIRRDLI